jgi:transposase
MTETRGRKPAFSSDDVLLIAELRAGGMKYRVIADKFDSSISTVRASLVRYGFIDKPAESRAVRIESNKGKLARISAMAERLNIRRSEAAKRLYGWSYYKLWYQTKKAPK